MKKIRFLSAIAIATIPVSLVATSCAPTEEGGEVYRNINLDKDWTFRLNDAEKEQVIDLPHDFSIIQDFKHTQRDLKHRQSSGSTGFLPGGVGYYHKDFILPKKDNATVILNFDGAYNDTIVSVNGNIVGNNRYGYNPFAFDISKYVVADNQTVNKLDVIVKHQHVTSSRWYPGSGIYRDVKVSVVDKLHITNNGTYVRTPKIQEELARNEDVTVNIDVDVQNSYKKIKSAHVNNRIVDADGNAITDWVASDDIVITQGTTETIKSALRVSNPKLWSAETPNLYYVETQLVSGNTIYDQYKTRFGFRYFNFDKQGFHVNGVRTKLHGVCLHHDQGALGAAAYNDAIYRQLCIMKEMGMNAVRTSHNCPDEDFLRMCDELGLYVMDEAFDGWEFSKTQHDFGETWKQEIGYGNQLIDATPNMEWNEFVMRSMVKRDRNCPSIFMWSLGNELHEGAWHDTDISWDEKQAIEKEMRGYGQKLEQAARSLDYDSDDQRWWGIALEYDPFSEEHKDRPKCKIGLDLYNDGGLLGYNYASDDQIETAISKGVTRLFGSETASANNSRGMYATIGDDETQEDFLVTSYDNAGRDMASEVIYQTLFYDGYAGQFVWTGFDYIGEPSPWCWNCEDDDPAKVLNWPYPNSAYYGIVDTCGFEKDSYYLYHAHLTDNDHDKKTLHLVGSFNTENMYVYNDGQHDGYTPVDVYTNAPFVLIKDKAGNQLAKITKTGAPSYEEVPNTYSVYSATSSSENCIVDESRESLSHDLYTSFLVKAGAIKELYAEAYSDSDCEHRIYETVGLNKLQPKKIEKGVKTEVSVDKETLKPDGESLAYVTVDLLDDNNNIITDMNGQNEIEVKWSGDGKVLGVDNGYQACDEKWQNPNIFDPANKVATIKTFAGKALIIVCSNELTEGATGSIVLTITNKITGFTKNITIPVQ